MVAANRAVTAPINATTVMASALWIYRKFIRATMHATGGNDGGGRINAESGALGPAMASQK